jgi:hypothetical protein
VISGFSDGTFRPNLPVTRGQLASLIVRFVEERTGVEIELGAPFADTPEDGAHTEALRKARTAGIVVGDRAGNAYPNQPIRRDQACRLFVRAFPLLPLSEDAPPLPS